MTEIARSSTRPGSVRKMLIWVLLIVVIPVVLVQAGVYYTHFRGERADELRVTLDIARAVGAAFNSHVQDLRREEFAVGQAFILLEPFSVRQGNSLMAENARQYPDLRSLSWVDRRGRVLASSQADLIGRDLGRTPWFRAISSGREWDISNLARSRVPAASTFSIAHGIRDSRGQLRGIVVAVVDPDRLGEVLPIKLSGGGAFAIIDRSGWIVYRHPWGRIKWDERDERQLSSVTRLALAGREASGVGFIGGLDQKRFIGRVPIGPIGWVAGSSRPEMEAIAPLRAEMLRDSAILLGVAFLAFLGATAAARTITLPISRLRGHALAVGQGDLERRMEATGPAEVVDLAAAFNRMAGELQAREHERERVLEMERARAQDARLLQTIQETTDACLAYFDRALRFVAVNSAYCRAAGRPREALIGRTHYEIWHNQEILDIYQRVLDSGEAARFNEMPRHDIAYAGESTTYWNLTVAPVKDDLGAVSGLVVSAVDVTAQVEARERIAAAERARAREARLLETIAQNSRGQLVYLDPDFNFVWVNDAYAKACRRSREEFIGHNHFEFYPHAENEAIFRRARDTGESVTFIEKPFEFPDQPERGVTYWDWTLTPIKDEEGAVEGLVFSLTDMTEQVRARERVAAVERERAQIAETVAAEINHRMKNNLMLVSGLLQLQRDTLPPGSPAAQALQQAMTRISALSVVHEQLYEDRSGKVELQYALNRIGEIVISALAAGDVELSVTGRRVPVHSRVGSALSVVANELLTNAVKHGAPGPSGRMRIEVDLAREEGKLRLQVWNSGNPVAPDFDLAQQSGMGLQIAREITTRQLEGLFSLRPERGGTVAELIIEESALDGGVVGV